MLTPTRLLIVCVLLVTVGCARINRIYEQDTGDLEAVPGPPAASSNTDPRPLRDASASPDPTTDQPAPTAIEFVDREVGPEAVDGPAPNAAATLDPDTDSIEPLPQPVPMDEPAEPRTYTIEKGDSYWKIAKKVYGDPMRMQDIADANPDVDPMKMQVGDEIILPE